MKPQEIKGLWLGLAGDPLWPASLLALAWAACLFRWA